MIDWFTIAKIWILFFKFLDKSKFNFKHWHQIQLKTAQIQDLF